MDVKQFTEFIQFMELLEGLDFVNCV